MNADELVAKYVKCRDHIKAKDKEHKDAMAKYKELLEKLGMALGKMMNKTGADSLKTKSGTAFKAEKDFVSVEDWDAVLKYAVDSGNLEMFSKSVKKDAAKEYMKENNGEMMPGTKYDKKIEIQVRRPK